MKPRLIMFSAVLLALLAGAGWFGYRASVVAATNMAAPSALPGVQTINGETVVTVSPEARRASHIEVAPLVTTTSQTEVTGYATVIDLRMLFDLHDRLARAHADVAAVSAQLANSRAQYQRSRTLFDDDRNVSQQSLQDAQSAMRVDEARLASAHATSNGLEGELRQQFGETLADATTSSHDKLFPRLVSGRSVVLRVTLPPGVGMVPPARIGIDAPNGHHVSAQRLSASPIADPVAQGTPWFYVVDDALPANWRMSAQLPTSSRALSGWLIPARAVVWYGGQTWVYVRTARDRFTRRQVPAKDERDQGFIVTSGFHAGDAVVTQGAQLLLSEELKPQGIATACKDPPECDD